jgi:hypothetical protein
LGAIEGRGDERGQETVLRFASRSGTTSDVERSVMNMFDLIKATITCGLTAFLIYSYPVIGQVVLIGVLSLLWLGYARKTLVSLLRR